MVQNFGLRFLHFLKNFLNQNSLIMSSKSLCFDLNVSYFAKIVEVGRLVRRLRLCCEVRRHPAACSLAGPCGAWQTDARAAAAGALTPAPAVAAAARAVAAARAPTIAAVPRPLDVRPEDGPRL